MRIKFGGADTRSIKMLNSFSQGFFISELVNNADEKIHRFLSTNYLENGVALFGKESSDELQDFREVCGGALDSISDEDVVGIIQFYVQRLRSYGHIESLFEAKIKQAKIESLGKPRTAMCKFYEGKILSVVDIYHQIKWFQTLSPEDYHKQISSVEFGIPPLYKNCRCSLEGIIPGLT